MVYHCMMHYSKTPKNIFLVGPMGAGKSTLGRQLAEIAKYQFYDTDKLITDQTGVDIPTIFDYEGEKGFRERESNAIKRIVKNHRIVLATGGGSVLKKNNRKLLKKRGFVVYLKTTVEEQLIRIGDDTNRPLMQTEKPEQTLRDLMAERSPLYEETAHLVFDTNAHKINTMAADLYHEIKQSYYEHIKR